ncbi:tRNA lysidine(34) synthetase TilS, partial [Candidatus Glomeribacter gigasporarum]|uniref:tRNA lysidine(34) synthetase TilS n=1 Tax=Candidatus Glomeribacter gigasporarum TaxID=132144 RepID=UPI00031CABA7
MASSGKRRLASPPDAERIPAAIQTALDTLDASYADSPCAIAFSGGLDSTVLLHAAISALGRARCIALHIHHGLNPRADSWLAHCRALAQDWGVHYAARRIDVDACIRQQRGTEAAAREARYPALAGLCAEHGARLALLGHQADDQAETVLLQLLRGAGLPGLAAMPLQKTEPASGLRYLRPLLTIPRALIERYATQHHLRWIEDDSNTSARYTRNRARQFLIPPLAAHFPAYRATLARAARHAQQAQRLLDELAQLDLQRVTQDDGDRQTLSRAAFSALNAARAVNLLRYWMRALGLPAASSARLEAMLRQLRDARASRITAMNHAGRQLRVYKGQIWWE